MIGTPARHVPAAAAQVTGLAPATIGAALLAGAALGGLLEKLDLCFHSAFRGLVLPGGDAGRFRIYLVAVLAQMPLVALLVPASPVQPFIPPFLPVANLVGGVIFGAGMVVAASCVSGLFFKLGRGMLGALLGLAAWGVGDIVAWLGPLAPLRAALQAPAWETAGPPTFPGLFGPFGWLIVVAAVLGGLAWLGRTARRTEWWGGLALALLVAVTWGLAAWSGTDYPFGTVGIPSQLWTGLTTGELSGSPWIALTLLALPVGAFLTARLGGRWWPRGETPSRYGQLALGGFLLGLGGALAGGCNIGHALIGVPLLAPGSWLATAAMVLGVGIAIGLGRLTRPALGARPVPAGH